MLQEQLYDTPRHTPSRPHKPTPSPGTPRQSSIHASKIGPYLVGKTLGVGSTGHVKLGVHVETGQHVAIKIIPRDILQDSTSSPEKIHLLRKKMEREITIMKLIQHPHVLQLYDVYENENELLLILEHVQGGELFDYIVQRGRLNESDALAFFQQIIFGVEFSHRHLIWYVFDSVLRVDPWLSE